MADQLSEERYVTRAWNMNWITPQRAILYGAAGRFDQAFECLDQAIGLRDPAMVYLAVGPQWDSLRADPRFADRLRALSLPTVA